MVDLGKSYVPVQQNRHCWWWAKLQKDRMSQKAGSRDRKAASAAKAEAVTSKLLNADSTERPELGWFGREGQAAVPARPSAAALSQFANARVGLL